MMRDGEDKRPSFARLSFSIYQVNQKPNLTPVTPDNKFKSSFQGLQVHKRHLSPTVEYDGLPGLKEELINKKDKDLPADQISVSVMNDANVNSSIGMLSTADKVKMWVFLLLYSLGRASMMPIMLMYPQPVAFKMYYRGVLVTSNYQE